ncbi:AraC-type DNA-binding protein [Arenibacter palladensis]|uniref:AraC-type DNA-binding protein n=1 Tax=Arenibacter palladensis TaxID=237373 RepID=A0A1M4XYZ9_9FLAO|nr:helix-turn-helix domain-containing protein [Arenibacter palladensis]SHE98721.1 AraC-type DNA-binding protein [Arenibacter palladensis]
MKKVYLGQLQEIISELVENEPLFLIIMVQLLLVQIVAVFFLIKNNPRVKSDYAQLKSRVVANIEQNKITKKYSNSGLSVELAKELKTKLQYLMDSEKTYLNPGLKLTDLASKIGISAHMTSQLINQEFGEDFNSYINSYRIKEVISIFRKGKYGSISEVFFYVGFNNKTTFNRAFKKYTKKTPSEFIESLNSNDSILWKI